MSVSLIDSTTQLLCANTGLAPGSTYYYRVSAVDSTGFEGVKSYATRVIIPALSAAYEYSTDASTVLLMHMNETGGATVSDASGLSNHGNAVGTSIADGRFGKVRDFDGSDCGITINNNLLGTGNATYTLEAWIMPRTVGSSQSHPLFSQRNSASEPPTIELSLGAVGQLDFIHRTDASAGFNLLSSPVVVGLNRWSHVAVVRNAGTSLTQLYINGVLTASGSLGNIGTLTGLNVFTIGKKAWGTSSDAFDGQIDEVRVSNVARTPQEFNLQLPPKSLTAGSSGLTVTLTWQNGGGATPLMRYRIYRGSDSASVVLVDSTTASTKSNTVSAAGTYYYRIAAIDSTGFESAKSFAAVANPSSPTLPAPVLSNPLNAETGVPVGLTLNWGAVAGATSYEVQVSPGSDFATLTHSASGITATTRLVTGLTNDTRYYWRVRATNNTIVSNWSTVWSFTTILAPPTLVSPADNSTSIPTSLTLSWNASTGATEYRVQVATATSFGYFAYNVGGIASTSTTVSGLTNLTRYYWRVSATNAASTSEWSPIWNFTTTDTRPADPTNLTATAVRPVHVNLEWSDNSSNETGFRILRRLKESGTFSEVGVVGTGATTFRDTGLIEWKTYIYTVRAYNAVGNSDTSNNVGVRTLDVTPPAPPQNTEVTPREWSRVNRFQISWINPPDASGIAKMFYRFDSQPTEQEPGDSTSVIDSTDIHVSVPSAGNHVAYFYLQDVAGNKNPASAVGLSVKFDDVPPSISHDSLSVAEFTTNSPQAIGITASAVDIHAGLKSLQLHYRTAGTDWTSATVANYPLTGGSVPIPATYVSASSDFGVDYRIVATDSVDNATASPTHSLSIVHAANHTHSDPSGNPITQTSVENLGEGVDPVYAYRLMSVPLILNDATPSDVLGTQTGLGSYDDTQWRFFRLNASGRYDEYPAFADQPVITPGAAFLLILKKPGVILKTGPGRIVKAEDINKDGIQLSQGYHFVGNPFNFEVSRTNLAFVPPPPVSSVWWCNGTNAGNSCWDQSQTVIKPWEGVCIFVNAPTVLIFNVADRPVTPSVESKIASKFSEESEPAIKARPWQLRIVAERKDNGLTDAENLFGVEAGATDSLDMLDLIEPPMIGDKGLALYSTVSNACVTHDFRAPGKDGYVWDLKVQTPDRAAAVDLSLDGLGEMTTDVFLVDVDSKMTYRPKNGEKVEVNSGNGGRHFRLIVGTVSFAEENSMGVDIIPKKFMLYQNYPNPFNPVTTIRYTIPDAARSHHVSVRIYNILGNEIATLVDRDQAAGYYEVQFDARSLSSGTYFCRLRIDGGMSPSGFTDTKKLILIK